MKTGCIKLIAEALRIAKCENEHDLGVWIGHTLGNTAAAEQMGDLGLRLIIDHEPLYVAVMEWCLRRPTSHETAMEFIIDESDRLQSRSG